MKNHASQIMSKKLLTVQLSDSLCKIFRIMQDRRIRHIPVADEQGEIIGILSDRDIQRAMTPKVEISRFLDEDIEIDPEYQAKDFMSWPVRAVTEDTPIQEVAERMLKEKISALLVMSRTRSVLGIVTTDDLLKFLIKLLGKEPGQLGLSLTSMIDEFSFTPGNWS